MDRQARVFQERLNRISPGFQPRRGESAPTPARRSFLAKIVRPIAWPVAFAVGFAAAWIARGAALWIFQTVDFAALIALEPRLEILARIPVFSLQVVLAISLAAVAGTRLRLFSLPAVSLLLAGLYLGLLHEDQVIVRGGELYGAASDYLKTSGLDTTGTPMLIVQRAQEFVLR